MSPGERERERTALVVGLLSYGSVRPKCSESGWLPQSHSCGSLVDKWKNTVIHNHTCLRLVMSGRGRHRPHKYFSQCGEIDLSP